MLTEGRLVTTNTFELVVFVVLDVVCGMEIDEKTAKWKTEHNGKTYYFCGPMCKMEFDENPEKYIESDNPKSEK